MRAGPAGLRACHVLVCSWLAIGAAFAHLQHALGSFRAWNAALLVGSSAIVEAVPSIAPWTRHKLVHTIVRPPRRVDYHRLVDVIASALQPRRAFLTNILVRIDDVLRLEARVALLRVVRSRLLLVAGRAAQQLVLARVVARHRPHPRAGNLDAAATTLWACLVWRAERAHACATRGPRGAAGTGYSSIRSSRIGKVKSVPALTRVRAHLPVKACGVSTRRALQAVGKGLGLGAGIIGILRAGTAGLCACHVLVRSWLAVGADLAHLQHALGTFRARNAALLVSSSAIVDAKPRIAPWTRLELVHASRRVPRRVDHHRHVSVIA